MYQLADVITKSYADKLKLLQIIGIKNLKGEYKFPIFRIGAKGLSIIFLF
jgi:hypothetical protein